MGTTRSGSEPGSESGSDERKNIYSNAVLRLMYLFRCFYNDEVARILKIKPERLYKETAIVNQFFDGRYALHYGGDSLPVKAVSDEDYVSVNPLWHVYDDPVKTQNLLKCSRQYGDFLYWVKSYFENEEYRNSEMTYLEYVSSHLSFSEHDKELSKLRSVAKKGKKKSKDVQKNSRKETEVEELVDNREETAGQELEAAAGNRFSELMELGAVMDDGDHYTESPIDDELDRLLKDGSVDYISFYNFLCYSMHFLHPSIYGYRLLKLVEEDALDDEVEIAEIPIKYAGFQAQSILSAEKCIDITQCIKLRRPLKFDYLKNEESVIEYASDRFKKTKKEVIPYSLVYDLRFGRYYMTAFDPKAVMEGDADNAMERFQVDYMEKLSLPRKTIKAIYNSIRKTWDKDEIKKNKNSASGEQYITDLMERIYHRHYEGTWISRGTMGDDGRYYKLTFIRRFAEVGRIPSKKDYEGYFSCDHQGYNEEEYTYYVILPNYLDIKIWVLEHMVPDNKGWFEIVKEEHVLRDGNGWKEVSGDPQYSLMENIRDTLETMENYYAVQ